MTNKYLMRESLFAVFIKKNKFRLFLILFFLDADIYVIMRYNTNGYKYMEVAKWQI